MKVCVIGLRAFPLAEGGVEKHCECLYPSMRGNVEFTVFRRKSYVKSDGAYDNIYFVDLPSTRIKGAETIIYSLLATLSAIKKKPDVVHIHNIGCALFSGLLACRGIPVVLTYHSPNYEHKKWGVFAKKLLLFCEKIAFRYSSRIIYVNKFQMEKAPEEIRRKSVYIPNGIVEPALTANTEYLSEIGVKPGKYALSVGRITPEKGFDTLIKGFRASSHDGYKLVIAGGVEFESGYMEKLKKLADGDVIFTGFVYGEKLSQLYTNAALYVLPSNNEGFPLVLLEAMSYHLDVLVTDIPATHLVRLNADDYFPCGDTAALAEKISRRLAAPKKRSYEMAAFNWDTTAAQTLEVLEQAQGKVEVR